MIKTIGNKHVCAVVSSIGGTVENFVFHSENIIFPPKIVGDKSRGGIPIPFPFFGKPSKEFSSIQQHGWLRHQELRLYKESRNQVVFVGENKVIEDYPWQLKYVITVSIDPATAALTLSLVIERLKDGCFFAAPINPGFHPYFCSDPSSSSEHCITRCLARVGSRVITDFEAGSSKIAVSHPILIKSGKRVLQMSLGGNFNSASELTLWTDNPDKYFCVEPVLTSRDAFAHPENGKFLKEGEKLEMTMELRVL